jgi:hypothetical protein
LREIGELKLKRSKGKRCWVEVFDWRLLELVRMEHEGRKVGYNIWKRCWICAI